MLCRDFHKVADSYLGDELLIETNHDVIAHLETCAACRHELTARRELRAKMRTAFTHAPEVQMRAEFAARLRTQLRATALQPAKASRARNRTWLALAACLIVAAMFGLVAVRQRQRDKAQAAQSASSVQQGGSAEEKNLLATPSGATDANRAVNLALTEMAGFAVGDHRNCAIKFHLPEQPISLEEAGRKYDRAYINLAQAMVTRPEETAGAIELLELHSCVFEGRRFGHVVLKYHGRRVSLLVTDLELSGAAAARQSSATSDAHQQAIACSQVAGYQVSCFETARHAVFVVSDLSEAENLNLARALAPSVSQHLTRAEGVA